MYTGFSVYIFAYFKFKTLLCLLKSTLAGMQNDMTRKPNNRIWYQLI